MPSTTPGPSPRGALLRWEGTRAALEDAEARGDTYAELVSLSEDVIRAHHDVTAGATGTASKDVRLYLSDGQLLIERDDTSEPALFPTSTKP